MYWFHCTLQSLQLGLEGAAVSVWLSGEVVPGGGIKVRVWVEGLGPG